MRIIYVLTLLLALFSTGQRVSAQNAMIDIDLRIGATNGVGISQDSYEPSDREYTAKFRVDTDISTGTDVCLTKNHGGLNAANYGSGSSLLKGVITPPKGLIVNYDLWEDDGGSRCSFDSGDDSRFVGVYPVFLGSPNEPGSYMPSGSQSNNSSAAFNTQMSWHFVQGSGSYSPSAIPQNTTMNDSRSMNVQCFSLVAGNTLVIESLYASLNESYLGVYAADGYTQLAVNVYKLAYKVPTTGIYFVFSQSANPMTYYYASPSSGPFAIDGATSVCIGNSTTLSASGGTVGTYGSTNWYQGSSAVAYSCEFDDYLGMLRSSPQFVFTNTGLSSVSKNSTAFKSTGASPTISFNVVGTINPNIYKYMQVRYRVLQGNPGNARIFYSNYRTAKATDQEAHGALIADGAWHILNIDMSASQYWTYSDITGWHFTWSDNDGVIVDLDYIALGAGLAIHQGESIGVSPLVTTTYWASRRGFLNETSGVSATVVVYTPSVVGTASLAVPTVICAGNGTALNVSGCNGAIQWQQSDSGYSWANVSGGSGASSASYNTAGLSKTTYFRAMVTNGVCSPVYSNTLTVTVDPISIGGVATATASAVCLNSNTTITLSGQWGNIQWQQSADNINWVNASGTGAQSSTYTTPNLTAKTYFRAMVTSGVCSSTYSTTATVSVTPPGVGGTATATLSSVCSGSGTSVTLTGYTGIIQWQQSPDNVNWGNVLNGSGATTATYTTPNLATKTYFRAAVSIGGCTPEYSTTATVNITPPSIAGTAIAAQSTVCSGNGTSLSLSGYTGAIQWQQSANRSSWVNVTGGSGAISANYTTAGLSGTTYFRAMVSNGGCTPAYSNELTVTVDPTSIGGVATASAAFVCLNSNTTITLTGHRGNIQWQQSADNTNWVNASGAGAQSSSYTTPNLTTKTYYRAIVTSGVCSLAYSTVAMVNITPTSVAGTATAAQSAVCSGNGTSVSLSGYTGSIQWQQSADNVAWGNVLNGTGATAATYITPNLTDKTYYRAMVTNGVCNSVYSLSVAIAVNKLSVIPSGITGNSTICVGSSTTLSVNSSEAVTNLGTNASWKWYSGSCGGTSVGTGTSITVSPTETTTYFVRGEGLCNTTACQRKTVTVNLITAITSQSTAAQSKCINQAFQGIAVNALGTSLSYQWYRNTTASNSGGVSLGTASGAQTSSYTPSSSIAGTSYYYYYCVVSGACGKATSAVSGAFLVYPASVGGTASASVPAICSGSTTAINL